MNVPVSYEYIDMFQELFGRDLMRSLDQYTENGSYLEHFSTDDQNRLVVLQFMHTGVIDNSHGVCLYRDTIARSIDNTLVDDDLNSRVSCRITSLTENNGGWSSKITFTIKLTFHDKSDIVMLKMAG